MEKVKISVEDKEYTVEIAKTEEERAKGLQDRKSLGDSEGMLFVFDKPQTVGFWMDKTEIPLDIIFIDEDEEVISVYKGKPFSKEIVEEDDVKYVLEVNQNSGIKEGDEIEGENMHLDKDILVKRNKKYSPYTCIFVPERINKLFENITFNPKIQNGKYVVRLRRKDDIKYLGRFETKEEAFQIYEKEKEKYIKQVADEYKPYIPRELYDAMYKYEVDINNQFLWNV